MSYDLPYGNPMRPVAVPESVMRSLVTPVMTGPIQGTVHSVANFNPQSDAEALKKAMKGLGCDDKAVMNIICKRTNQQRQQIISAYKTMYGKDLTADLISELHGHFEDVIVALMYTPEEFDVLELNRAMKGVGTDEATLIEILCTRTNAEIAAIKQAYKNRFKKDLESAITSDTSGYFKRLLVSLSNAGRHEGHLVDRQLAVKQAQDLHSAGVKRWGTDEATFNAILCAESFPQLHQVFEEYKRLAGHDIEEAIHREFSGDVQNGLLTIVKCVKNRPAVFAEHLHRSMAGLGTNDRALIRTVVSRCEKDMVQIKQEFQRMYNKSLESWITGDTSGKYKDALLMLIGEK